MHILFALQTAFSFWMLYDAAKRRADYYWYAIILMPFGEWVYFFVVKMNDREFKNARKTLFSKPTSIEELQYRARTSPSIQNKVTLAQALHDKEDYGTASNVFREVLAQDDEDKDSIYGLARCLTNLKETAEAVEMFELLCDLDPSYDNHAPCIELARLYCSSGQRDKAINLLKRMTNKSSQLHHKVELAKVLLGSEQHDEARALLEETIEDFNNGPSFIKKRYRREVREAKSLLSSLPR